MKIVTILIFIAVGLTGCATRGGWPCWAWSSRTDQKDEAAGREYLRTNSPAIHHSMMTPLPAQPGLVPFIYPADMTNYTWTLERSDDLGHWVPVDSFGNGLPEAPYDIPATDACGFYRMRGDLIQTN